MLSRRVPTPYMHVSTLRPERALFTIHHLLESQQSFQSLTNVDHLVPVGVIHVIVKDFPPMGV